MLRLSIAFLLYNIPFSKSDFRDSNPSYSDQWSLPYSERQLNRQEGYCLALCGVTYNKEADGYSFLRDNYDSHKHLGINFGLRDAFIGSYYEEESRVFEHLDQTSSYSGRSLAESTAMIDYYCADTGMSFEECFQLQRAYSASKQGNICYRYCDNEVFDTDMMPDFEKMAPDRQSFEKCLDSFAGPHNIHSVKDDPKLIHETFQKFGFVIVKNVLKRELVLNVTNIMNEWDDTGHWNNLTYTDYYSAFDGQLRDYENRLEVILPKVEPFDTLFRDLHSSVVMDVLSYYGEVNYGSHRPISIDFITTIMSRPGATVQGTHADHGFEASLSKIAVAIHDIHEASGPTSFCPCTHRGGSYSPAHDKPCSIRFHADFIPAGSVIIYDQTVHHRGSPNNGSNRRWLLDLSYMFDEVYNPYERTFPQKGQDDIKKYRSEFRNLNQKFL